LLDSATVSLSWLASKESYGSSKMVGLSQAGSRTLVRTELGIDGQMEVAMQDLERTDSNTANEMAGREDVLAA
jgi:hypothetical protein